MFNAVRLAFAMFSKIPMGRPDWSGKSMRYMLCAFPLVGVVIGALEYGWLRLTPGGSPLPDAVRALGMTLLPLAVTGGIHLDGLCDVADARASHAEPKQKREILKDPRAGAFGVLGVSVYLLSYFALSLAFPFGNTRNGLLFALGFAISRAVSGLLVVFVRPPAGADGLGRTFHDAAARRGGALLLVWLAVLLGAVAAVSARGGFPTAAILFLLCPGAWTLYALRVAKREFGGLSGDISGWFLQLCELIQLAVIVLSGGFL